MFNKCVGFSEDIANRINKRYPEDVAYFNVLNAERNNIKGHCTNTRSVTLLCIEDLLTEGKKRI